MIDRCRWSEAAASIAPDGRAGRRPTHHPRGRIPTRQQAVGRSARVPLIDSSNTSIGGLQIGGGRVRIRPPSEVSQKSSYPRAIGTRASELNSGTLSRSDRPMRRVSLMWPGQLVASVGPVRWPWTLDARLSNPLLVGAGWRSLRRSGRHTSRKTRLRIGRISSGWSRR
jgi:hypothetical protein